MAILSKGNTYSSGDPVTADNLNALVDSATFVSGSNQTTDNSTLEVHTDGYLKIKDDGVNNAKIATGAVNADSIAENAVGNSELADNAVQTANIADSTGTTDGVTTAKIANEAVTSAKIANEAVTSAKISSTDTELNYVNGGVGIGTLNETGYDLTATKVKLKGTATQLFFEDTDEAGTPTEIAMSLNSKALRFGFQDSPTTQAFAIFGRNLTIAGGTVAQMNALTAADGALLGQVAYVSNGNAGSPCLAMYDGSAWKVIATLGATISA